MFRFKNVKVVRIYDGLIQFDYILFDILNNFCFILVTCDVKGMFTSAQHYMEDDACSPDVALLREYIHGNFQGR